MSAQDPTERLTERNNKALQERMAKSTSTLSALRGARNSIVARGESGLSLDEVRDEVRRSRGGEQPASAQGTGEPTHPFQNSRTGACMECGKPAGDHPDVASLYLALTKRVAALEDEVRSAIDEVRRSRGDNSL